MYVIDKLNPTYVKKSQYQKSQQVDVSIEDVTIYKNERFTNHLSDLLITLISASICQLVKFEIWRLSNARSI